MESLEDLIERYWCFAKFAFDTSAKDSLVGLEREVVELRDELAQIGRYKETMEEFADVFFYYIYCLKRSGATVENLKDAMEKKLEILKNRQWKKNPDGTYSHI